MRDRIAELMAGRSVTSGVKLSVRYTENTDTRRVYVSKLAYWLVSGYYRLLMAPGTGHGVSFLSDAFGWLMLEREGEELRWEYDCTYGKVSVVLDATRLGLSFEAELHLDPITTLNVGCMDRFPTILQQAIADLPPWDFMESSSTLRYATVPQREDAQ